MIIMLYVLLLKSKQNSSMARVLVFDSAKNILNRKQVL